MMIRILLFGIARDIVGSRILQVDNKLTDVGALLDFLKSEYPQFIGLKSLLVAVNDEYADANTPISEKDEIAIIPPVSGG